MKKNLLIISISTFIILYASAENRIQAFRFDQSQTQTISLSAGLGSRLLLPCPVLEVLVGRTEDLKAEISPNDPKVVYLNLKKTLSSPTNLIVTCENNRNVFVFDIVPSNQNHQDIVEIRSSYGRPEYSEAQRASLIEIKEVPSSAVVLKKPIVVEKGN